MSQSFGGSELNILPNLPGFRPRQPQVGPRKAYFEVLEGQRCLRDDTSMTNTLSALDADCTTIIIGSPGKKKISHKDIGKVLTFSAYFEEKPDGLSAGSRQIRKCNIFYYLEDDTIKIVEKPQLNSGVTQGTLVRRNAVSKSDGSQLTAFDFQIGESVIVYGRPYTLTDCDSATRTYMRDNYGFDYDGEEVEVPEDQYQKYRKSLQAGEEDTWGKFHSKKNDNKTFNEARLGAVADNSGREGFMKYANSTLNFRCMWDNTHNLYGDVLYFSLMYYLSDDTIEIMSIPGATVSTTDGGKVKLLKRSKLPRNFELSMTLGEKPPSSAFFKWMDIYIGLELQVFGRKLLICDADRRTREFYQNNSEALGEPIYQPEPEIMVHKREIPPPTGFGSEEDSLRSVSGSLMPGPVPAKKLGENKMLSFFASLLSGGIDDVDRRFVITYFVTDNTLKVIEPPVRNSGFTGGVFLSRREVKNEKGDILRYPELYIGCKLKILKHVFLLLDANDSTLKWMEDNKLSRSNYYAILDKIRPLALTDAKNGEMVKLFKAQESPKGGSNQATIAALRKVLNDTYRIIGDQEDDVSEHELRTILRGAGNKKDTFNYVKFVEQIVNPTDEFK